MKEMLQITQIYSEQVWILDWVIAHDLERKESLSREKKGLPTLPQFITSPEDHL